jgi:DNA-binding HxlR family transcriptional regulator
MRIVNRIAYKILLAVHKPKGFNEIVKEYRLSPNALNQCGLITREVSKSPPVRVKYTLTPKGATILDLLIEIDKCEPKLTTEGYV